MDYDISAVNPDDEELERLKEIIRNQEARILHLEDLVRRNHRNMVVMVEAFNLTTAAVADILEDMGSNCTVTEKTVV